MNAIQLFAVSGRRGRVHFRPSPTRITSIGPGLNELKIHEAKCGKALLRELVVSCGDTRPILEPTKAATHDIASLAGFSVMADFLLAICFSGDDGLVASRPASNGATPSALS
jgi:hypothetical protein